MAEACAQIDRSCSVERVKPRRYAVELASHRWRGGMISALPRTMLDGLFFGTATQGEAARLWWARGALREEEDEGAQGHDDGLRRERLPRQSAGQQSLFVRLSSSRATRASCDRTPCGLRLVPRREACDRARRGLREVEWARSAATARGSKSGGAQRKGLPPDQRPRSRTTRTRPGQEASSRSPRSVAAPTGHQYYGGAP